MLQSFKISIGYTIEATLKPSLSVPDSARAICLVDCVRCKQIAAAWQAKRALYEYAVGSVQDFAKDPWQRNGEAYIFASWLDKLGKVDDKSGRLCACTVADNPSRMQQFQRISLLLSRHCLQRSSLLVPDQLESRSVVAQGNPRRCGCPGR